MSGARAATARALRGATVLLLVDEGVWLPRSRKLLDRYTETEVEASLRSCAGRVVTRPFEGAAPLLRALDDVEPDVVFNLTQHAHGDRRMDAHVCALLELRGVAYTGTGPHGLMLCRDKVHSKTIAASSGFAVPASFVPEADSPADAAAVRARPKFPLVVKPRFGDASEGIAQASLVRTRSALARRVAFLRECGFADVVCEEFVPGREFSVGVVGERAILPPAESVVGRDGRGAPRLACARSKYDRAFRERWAVSTAFPELPPALVTALEIAVLRACAALGVRDYGRVDVKLTPAVEWVFLEANPNPGLANAAFSGGPGGIAFDALVEEIARRALARKAVGSPGAA